MERISPLGYPNLILCSDIHLREDIPICRIDNYWEAQWKKIDFISNLQKKYNCPVLHGGDLFDHWKPSPNLLRETILHLPDQFYTIYGQHDLPQHSLELVDKCGINVLEAAGKLQILDGTHWGELPKKESLFIKIPDHSNQMDVKESCDKKYIPKRIINVLLWHVMNYVGQKPWPGCTDSSAIKLLQKYPQFNLILTGDNHKPFVETFDGRLLVNPGSMMRMDADQMDFKPRVYLWYAETNTVSAVYLPIQEGAVSREHLEKITQREGRIDAYVSKLDLEWKSSLNYEDNIKILLQKNHVRESVKTIIYKAIDQES
jgi:DNA repair exonuclease SbcCD nuclease subunit